MAIKKSDKSRKHTSRNLEDHVINTAEAEIFDTDTDKVEKYQVSQGEIHSSTHLEDDTGEGSVAIIRFFDFKANPEAFHRHTPSKQELFNAHSKQIEIQLWNDGLEVMPEVKPQVILNKRRTGYRIVVGATPKKSDWLSWERRGAKTLTQIVNDPRTDSEKLH